MRVASIALLGLSAIDVKGNGAAVDAKVSTDPGEESDARSLWNPSGAWNQWSKPTRRPVNAWSGWNWDGHKWNWSWGGGWGPQPTDQPTKPTANAWDNSWSGKGSSTDWVLNGWGGDTDTWATWAGNGWSWASPNNKPVVVPTPAPSSEVPSGLPTSPAPTCPAVPSDVPRVLAQSKNELVLDDLAWPPDCGLTEDECKSIFCDILQTFLQDELCPGGASSECYPCAVAVLCDPVEITPEPEPENKIDRLLLLHGTWKIPFDITLIIECASDPGDCSDTTSDLTAVTAAMKSRYTRVANITDQDVIDGFATAIEQQVPPLSPPVQSFFVEYTFTIDPNDSTLSDPTASVFPTDIPSYAFMGKGDCVSQNGYIPGYFGLIPTPRYTLQQCADICEQNAVTDCWVQNQGTYPFRGISYNLNGVCFCLYEILEDYPSEICTLPLPADDITEDGGYGIGPVVSTRGPPSDYFCFKYIGSQVAEPSEQPSEEPSGVPTTSPVPSEEPSEEPSGVPTSSAPTCPAVPSDVPSDVPRVLAQSKNELALDDLAWPPDCGLTEDECKSIFCDILQTFLQDDLCPGGASSGECYPCAVAALCDPVEITSGAYKIPVDISLIIECASPVPGDCSETAAAATAAMTSFYTRLATITAQDVIDGFATAIEQQEPSLSASVQSFFEGYTFTFDPAGSELEGPSTSVFPTDITGPYVFMGVGECISSKGDYYGIVYFEENQAQVATLQACADGCLAANANVCWDQATYPFRGISYDGGTCYCHFETLQNPNDICSPLPPDVCDGCQYGNDGIGPVVSTDGVAHPSGIAGYLCFKYIG